MDQIKRKDILVGEKENDAGGGILLDQGIHMVDMINFFSGIFLKLNLLLQTIIDKKS